MQSFPEAGGTDAGAGTGKEASKQHQSKMSGTLEREVEGWSYWCLSAGNDSRKYLKTLPGMFVISGHSRKSRCPKKAIETEWL